MAKVINITNRFSTEKPKIVIGEDEFEVNNTVETVLKFDELANSGGFEALQKAVDVALGNEAAKKLDIMKMPISSMKILVIAIMAAMQDLEFEEAESRFQKFE